jgi:hypothetical protein
MVSYGVFLLAPVLWQLFYKKNLAVTQVVRPV